MVTVGEVGCFERGGSLRFPPGSGSGVFYDIVKLSHAQPPRPPQSAFECLYYTAYSAEISFKLNYFLPILVLYYLHQQQE